MKRKQCLSEQDLILHHYGELHANQEQTLHIAKCLLCKERLSALKHDLSKLPHLPHDPDAAAGARMAARVSEQLRGRRRKWLPAIGASAVAACALLISISIWSPQKQLVETAQLTPTTPLSLNEDMPDIDFLEDLELLQELELLSQIEGV